MIGWMVFRSPLIGHFSLEIGANHPVDMVETYPGETTAETRTSSRPPPPRAAHA
ncbi:hypothetical protein CCP2SC5_590008 [Azospirillaceae bacterium]